MSANETERVRLPLEVRFWRHVDKSGECWMWTGAKTKSGYGHINRDHVKGHMVYAHRVSWELANGIPPAVGLDVCHRCDTPACVRPSHLFLGTCKENSWDMVAKGRNNGHMHALTPSDAIDIVTLNAFGATARSLQEAFGVSESTINRVLRGATFGAVTGMKRDLDDKA